MSKIQTSMVIIFTLLFISAMTQRPKHYPEDNQIQNPFHHGPVNQQNSLQNNQIPAEVPDSQKIEEYVPSEQRKQKNEEFNEVLGYGMISGVVALAFTILRTCLIEQGARRVHLATATVQQNVTNHNQFRTPSSAEILHQIENHKNQIKRLEILARRAEEYEREVFQTKRQNQTINMYQMQLEQTTEPRNYYNYGQQTYGQVFEQQQIYQRNEFIPVGRPLPRGIDSPFKQEYPTI